MLCKRAPMKIDNVQYFFLVNKSVIKAKTGGKNIVCPIYLPQGANPIIANPLSSISGAIDPIKANNSGSPINVMRNDVIPRWAKRSIISQLTSLYTFL